MDYQKELLLFVASTFVSSGAVVLSENILYGVGLMLLGALVFVGRGFYKKHIDDTYDRKTKKRQ